jgi:hypothetical protein
MHLDLCLVGASNFDSWQVHQVLCPDIHHAIITNRQTFKPTRMQVRREGLEQPACPTTQLGILVEYPAEPSWRRSLWPYELVDWVLVTFICGIRVTGCGAR